MRMPGGFLVIIILYRHCTVDLNPLAPTANSEHKAMINNGPLTDSGSVPVLLQGRNYDGGWQIITYPRNSLVSGWLHYQADYADGVCKTSFNCEDCFSDPLLKSTTK